MRNTDEFFDSVDDIFDMEDDGYQTDTDGTEDEEPEEMNDDTQEEGSDDEADSEEDETDEDSDTDADEEDGSEDDGEGEDGNTDAAPTFTIKVNKEERTVTLEEMTTLAQKGADYDRVKEQNSKHQQTITDLQSKLDGMAAQQGVLDILDNIAQKSGSSLEQLAESLYINFRKSAGASEDVAREELKNAKLEKELNAYKNQQAKQQEKENDAEARAQRDMDEFNRDYPDVALTEELVDKLIPDIQKGMTLSAAYRKHEKAQDSARIADLERQLAAKAQNKKNRAKATGSKRDSGAGNAPDLSDVFERELFR